MATFPNFDSFTIPIIRNLYDRSFYDLDSLISSINWNKKKNKHYECLRFRNL